VSQPLVLSLFPGIGLLDMAFEAEGFCVVRGPDLLWGGDIKRFHPPAGKFDGVIGGPPCQHFSPLVNLKETVDRYGNMVPEFERCVVESAPTWFLMENVRDAVVPCVLGYDVDSVLLNNRWFGEEQNRVRRFSLGSRDGRALRSHIGGIAALMNREWSCCVTAAHSGERRTHFNKGTGDKIQRYTVEQALRLQGLPTDFFGERQALKRDAQLRVIANGVPLPMGRAVAQAVKRALGYPLEATA
jgi:DNA (cytosine-5)-methyltransferase 1